MTEVAEVSGSSDKAVVDVFSVACGKDQNEDLLVLDLAYDAVISYAVSPETVKWTRKGFAQSFGGVCSGYTVFKVLQDSSTN